MLPLVKRSQQQRLAVMQKESKHRWMHPPARIIITTPQTTKPHDACMQHVRHAMLTRHACAFKGVILGGHARRSYRVPKERQ